MKKMNKKGFTIVELVIVIAVIAILAAVMIPTFSGIVGKAQESAALQEATNAYKQAYANALLDDGNISAADNNEKTDGTGNVVNGFTFTWADDGTVSVTTPNDFGYTVTVKDGVVTVNTVTTTPAGGSDEGNEGGEGA